MLPLESARWAELVDAYGTAEEIPRLLEELKGLPDEKPAEAEPYFSLWSALCHQGDIYSASYAALPHVVAAIEGGAERTPWTLFLMVACIEMARAKGRVPEIPEDLQGAYFEALGKTPEVVAKAAKGDWDHWACGAALAAIAAAKGFTGIAEAILQLDPDPVAELIKKQSR